MSQMTFRDYEYSLRKRKTKREEFLDIMNEIIPWEEWVEFVRPYYPNGKRGRPTKGIEKMLRMYLLQIWFNLSDEGVEDAIYDSYAFQKFMNIDFMEEQAPCSLPRKTQKTDTQNEKNAPEHHVQERFLLPINGVLPLFYPFNFSSILATCRKICLSVSLLLVSFSVSSFGLSVVVVAFFANPFSPAALMIAG